MYLLFCATTAIVAYFKLLRPAIKKLKTSGQKPEVANSKILVPIVFTLIMFISAVVVFPTIMVDSKSERFIEYFTQAKK